MGHNETNFHVKGSNLKQFNYLATPPKFEDTNQYKYL